LSPQSTYEPGAVIGEVVVANRDDAEQGSAVYVISDKRTKHAEIDQVGKNNEDMHNQAELQSRTIQMAMAKMKQKWR